MKKIVLLLFCLATANLVLAQKNTRKPALTKSIPAKTAVVTKAAPATKAAVDGIFATIETNKGNIVLELEFKKTPITVANFVSLAEGTNNAVKPEFRGKPFYNGLKFHRVIKDFMIQGGDPLGNGSGDPGYKFKDEFTSLNHDKAGILSMANSGPGTNGSQFFITHKDTPWLNGKHTIFGHVVTGQNVVDAITQDDAIKTIKIVRKGDEAKAFDAGKIFNTYFINKDAEQAAENAKRDEAQKAAKMAYRAQFGAVMDAKVKELAEKRAKATKSASGLEYLLTSAGGAKPAADATVYVHYAGFFEDGTLFDSSFEAVNKAYGKFDQNRANANGYSPFPFKVGTKSGMIPGFLEALELLSVNDKATVFIPSKLGYGERGYGAAIPPNSNLIFEIELLDKLPEPATKK